MVYIKHNKNSLAINSIGTARKNIRKFGNVEKMGFFCVIAFFVQ